MNQSQSSPSRLKKSLDKLQEFSLKILELIRDNPGYSFLAVVLLLYATYVMLGSLLRWFIHPVSPPTLTTWGFVHLLFWTLGPPIWFFLEYHLESDADKRKQLKDSQDVASKIWAGVLVVLVFSLTSQLKISNSDPIHVPEPAAGSAQKWKGITRGVRRTPVNPTISNEQPCNMLRGV